MYTNISYIQIYVKIQIIVKTSHKSHSLQLGLFTSDIEIVCFNGIRSISPYSVQMQENRS